MPLEILLTMLQDGASRRHTADTALRPFGFLVIALLFALTAKSPAYWIAAATIGTVAVRAARTLVGSYIATFTAQGVWADTRKDCPFLSWSDLRSVTIRPKALRGELLALNFGDRSIELNLDAFPHYSAGVDGEWIMLRRRAPVQRRGWRRTDLALAVVALSCSVAIFPPLPMHDRIAGLVALLSFWVSVETLLQARFAELAVMQEGIPAAED